MFTPTKFVSRVAFVAALAIAPSVMAQPQGSFPTTPSPTEGEDKPKGVAEAAPKGASLLPTTQVLPPLRERGKKFRLVEIDGYLRLRMEWLKNYHMGFNDQVDEGGAPFPRPLSCQPLNDGDTVARPCKGSFNSSNMRLRLEPTFHVSESATIHTQIDLLDNQVLGATPFRDGQVVGGLVDSTGTSSDSIVVKRAWASVYTPLALLEFGRMPNHWGLGMLHNSGGADPIHQTYNYNGDFGDTIDRIALSNTIPGTNLRGMVAMDWPFSGLSTDDLTTGQAATGYGQGWDLDDSNDSKQWTIAVSRLDPDREFREDVASGQLAYNYGIHFSFRKQSWDDVIGGTDEPNGSTLVPRSASALIPDLWLRLGKGNMSLELEGAATLGSIDNLSDQAVSNSADLIQLGAVARFGAHWMNERLKFGFETGYASGDSADSDVPGNVHISTKSRIPSQGDTKYSLFAFDRDYHVDMIYFRQIAGAVHNAVYLRPSLSFDFAKAFRISATNITSFAARPVATPGNEAPLGTEFDVAFSFEGEALSLGIGYGLFIPFAGLDHLTSDINNEGFGFSSINLGDASNAQTFQFNATLKF